MALAYIEDGMTESATFSLFVRSLPPERGFLVAAGLEEALSYLENLQIDEDDIAAFATAMRRSRIDVAGLQDLRFSGDVWAIPEGRIVFPGEPLLEVTAPLPEAQFVETYLLNKITYATALASKAARCIIAAQGKPVIDFSLRRTHGAEAGMKAARAGAIVGFAGTSNVAAAVEYSVPAVGTMAHSFIEAFQDEGQAFRAFARATTGPVTLLVDTYDTERGLHIAAHVLRGLKDHRDFGVRLDSGDLVTLSILARDILDAAGLDNTRIVASGGLDEYSIDRIVTAGAPIDVFAVGTKVGTSADFPHLDSAYKLVQYAGQPVMKLSAAKVTSPAPKQVYRRSGAPDVIALRTEERPADSEPLLQPFMTNGRRVAQDHHPATQVGLAHQRFIGDLAALPSRARLIRGPSTLPPIISSRLAKLSDELYKKLVTITS